MNQEDEDLFHSCEIQVRNLFPESSQVASKPVRHISYAEAIGYENMQVLQPRNPIILGYDAYIGDLFEVDNEDAKKAICSHTIELTGYLDLDHLFQDQIYAEAVDMRKAPRYYYKIEIICLLLSN